MRIRIYLPMIIIAALTWISPFRATAAGDENPDRLILTAANEQYNIQQEGFKPAQAVFNPESGSVAWAHNAWTREIYNFDIDVPTTFNVIDTVNFQTFCGDFTPGDSLLMWVIQYPENKLRTINIMTGETNVVADLPVPLVDGIWTSLIVEKSTGNFYAIATDGLGSVLYSVDPVTGETEEVFGLGLQAVISSTFDASGNLYVFDIESDSTYVVDIALNEITTLGPAGFDGNYAQGMGYDPNSDEIYLAAYNNEQGPQLRKLNKLTGETSLISALPGETGAFGFPTGSTSPQVAAGPDETICENQTLTTSLATASGYFSLEWSSSGDGTFDSAELLQTVYYPGSDDILEGSVELCLAAIGPDGTTQATDCLMLSILNMTQADAGPDATISSGDDFEITGASAQHYTTLIWTSSGDGTFNDPTLLLPVYSTGANDLNNGGAELCLTAYPAEPCTMVANACLNLSIEEIPEGIDFGDAPENTGNPLSFPTTLAQNGAAHSIDPLIYLGQKIDGEPDGQPDPDALGDDNDLLYPSFGDDEDGVEIPPFISQGTEVNITITASVDGFLDAWIDFNQDQAWLNPSEHVLSVMPLVSGSNTLSFVVPPAAVPGQSYIRFRYRDYPQPLDAGGFAYNGEVEDYKIEISEAQAEDMDFGDAPSNGNTSYPTLFTQDGARHKLVESIHLGTVVDSEPDGQPYNGALGDDQDIYFPSLGDDEDGVILPESVQSGSQFEIEVYAAVDGFLDTWMDFNRDGNWSDDEHIFNTLTLMTGSNSLQISVPDDAATGQTYLRFRFRDYAEPLAPKGLAENGEVEDYAIMITEQQATQFDFGDAPGIPGLFAYPTQMDDDGARHIFVPGIFLGESVDAEPDGQPSPDASGDDNDLYYPSGGDDEDGVQFQGQLATGATVNISVTASVDGFLEAWIDYNRDGDWNDAAEHIFISQALVQGNNIFTITIPENAETGSSFARFRFSNYDAKPGPAGQAENGEVEDYMILIQQNTQSGFDFGDAPDTAYPTTLQNNGARHLNNGQLFLGNLIDSEPDGISSEDALGDNNTNLNDEDGVTFLFPLLVNNEAQINVNASAEGYLSVWIDFEQNGNWTDEADNIFTDQILQQGNNTLTFDVPALAIPGITFLRCRLSSETGLTFSGPAIDGEVEDYEISLYPDWSFQPTQSSHSIMFPPAMFPLIKNDLIGVFFENTNGELQCGGLLQYSAQQVGQLIAYGDDPSTSNFKEGFDNGEPFSFKVFSSLNQQVNDLFVIFDSLFPNHDGTFASFGISAVKSAQYSQNLCSPPDDWEFLITGSAHSINIPLNSNPNIEGTVLEPGDWIGAFYETETGQGSCGAVQWTGYADVVITVYGDDPFTTEKDGLTSGESIQWKLFDCSNEQVYEAAAEYNQQMPCQGDFGEFCLSEIVLLSSLRTTTNYLFEGWNSISTYLIPYDGDVETIFADYTNELIIMRNLNSMYWPSIGVNTIGDWDLASGYAIKLNADIDLNIKGISYAGNNLVLEPGWHYLPVLSECTVLTSEIFQEQAEKITIVQDLIGNRVWWPDMNVYTLLALEPGRAYKIRVEESIDLVFPDCNFKAGPEISNNYIPDEFDIPENKPVKTPYSHTIVLEAEALGEIADNDLIAAMNESGAVHGLSVVNDEKEKQIMVVAGDDPSTELKDGFEENEEMAFYVLSSAGKKVAKLEANFQNVYGYTNRFKTNGLSVVTNLQPKNRVDKPDINIYPNPGNGLISISGLEGTSLITFYNPFGMEIENFIFVGYEKIDLSRYPKGVYLVQIKYGEHLINKKLIIQ